MNRPFYHPQQIRSLFNEWMESVKKRKYKSYQAIEQLTAELHEEENLAGDVEPSENKRFWKFRLVGVVVVLLGYFLFQSLTIIYLIVAAFIIAMAMNNMVEFFHRKMPRGLAIGIAYFLLLLFVLSGVMIVVPFVLQQVIEMINIWLTKVYDLQQVLQDQGLEATILMSHLPMALKNILIETMISNDRWTNLQQALVQNMTELISVGTSYIKNAGNVAVIVLGGFFSAILQVFLVFILSIFFTIEKEKVISFLAHISGRAKYTELKLLKLYRKLGFRLEGQLILCFAIGIIVWVGLIVLSWFGVDLPNKFTLALIAGLTEFIPYLWPLMGMFPAILLGILGYGWEGGLAVIALYWLIQQSENNILVPMVMYQTLGISPLLILVCMIIGGSILWFIGIILAVPIAVILSILFEDYSHQPWKKRP